MITCFFFFPPQWYCTCGITYLPLRINLSQLFELRHPFHGLCLESQMIFRSFIIYFHIKFSDIVETLKVERPWHLRTTYLPKDQSWAFSSLLIFQPSKIGLFFFLLCSFCCFWTRIKRSDSTSLTKFVVYSGSLVQLGCH